MDNTENRQRENLGMFLGLLGVAGFSGTLPATRLAVASLDATLVGLGRAVVAALLAALVLYFTRQSLPNRRQIRSLAIVAGGVVIGFPLLMSLALKQLPSAHSAIVIAILPLFTALAGALRTGDRPSYGFWLTGLACCFVLLIFSTWSSGSGLQSADLILLIATMAGGIGYAEGGRLAKELGGWQVICWALVLAAPFLLLPVGLVLYQHGINASHEAWLGFAYVSLISQLFGFFLWYQGMALGGVVRVSQVQFLQPFMTLAISAFLLGEQVTTGMMGVASFVVAMVIIGKRMPITPHSDARDSR